MIIAINSGIEWIGDIPKGWELRRIQHCLQEVNVKNNPIQTSEVLSLVKDKGVMPYGEKGNLGNKAKEDVSEYKLAYPNTLVVNSMNILIGSVGLCDYFGCVSPVYYVFKETVESDLRFINYIFNTRDFQKELHKYARGILEIRLRVSAEDIFKRKIALPAKEVQIRIADFLDGKCAEIDGLVVDIQAEIDCLEQYKKSVITKAITKGLDPDVPIKDSCIEWVGMVPEHWDVARMQDIGCYKKGPFGSAITKNMFVEKGTDTYKVYEQKNAIQKDATLGYYYIPVAVYKGLEEFSLAPQDIIVSCAGTIGECFIMPNNMEKGIINQALMRIRLNENVNLKYFIYVFDVVLDYANLKYSNGSAIKNIPPFAILKKLKIPVPPIVEQGKIARYLDDFCCEVNYCIEDKKQQLSTLMEYKRSLIYEYVTGKKEVPGE